jgi:opacity protein-like surface antigen
MKRIVLCGLLLGVLSASALASGPIGFGVQATGAVLNVPDPLKTVYGPGFGGGAHIDINLPIIFSIRIAADYTTYAPDNDKLAGILATESGRAASDFSLEGGRFNIFSLSANAKFALPTPVLSPYITGGGGIASVSMSDLTVKYQGTPIVSGLGGSTGTKSSLNIGAGVELNMVLTLYLEAKYTVIFTEGESSSFVPVSLGITF